MKDIQEYFIEKGTKLYRRSDNKKVSKEMFFGFCPFGTYSSFHLREPIQLWITKCDKIGNLMLKDVTNRNRLKSSLVNIYKDRVVNENIDIIQLKKFGYKRDNLLNYFKVQGITNWITSVEDKYEMELFLFGSANENFEIVEYRSEVDSNLDYEKLNSFEYSKINCR